MDAAEENLTDVDVQAVHEVALPYHLPPVGSQRRHQGLCVHVYACVRTGLNYMLRCLSCPVGNGSKNDSYFTGKFDVWEVHVIHLIFTKEALSQWR